MIFVPSLTTNKRYLCNVDKSNRKGVILQFEVEDVEKEYNRIKSLNLEIVVDLIKEEVNENHFTVRDPSGLLIDIVNF